MNYIKKPVSNEDIEELAKLLQEHPDAMPAYLVVVAAYNRTSGYDPGQELWWDQQLRCWVINNPKTDTYCQIEFHGLTKSGDLKFRMFDSLFPRKRWFTVIFPITGFHVVEIELCEHEGTQEASDGHRICAKCGELF